MKMMMMISTRSPEIESRTEHALLYIAIKCLGLAAVRAVMYHANCC